MSRSYFRLRVATPFAACVAALLLALCAGAVWSVVAVIVESSAAWMVVPTVYVARFGVSHLPFHSAAARAWAAAALVVIGTAYALYLQAASVITAQLGVPFGESILTVGPSLAWMIVHARTPPMSQLVILIAPLVAAVVAYVEQRRASSTAT